MKISAAHVEALRPLFTLIYDREAAGSYNAVNRGKAGDTRSWRGTGGRQLVEHTLAEVQGLQERKELFAVGAMQAIPETLRLMAAEMKLLTTERFDHELQDRITAQLLLGRKRPPVRDYLLGKVSGDPALAKAVDALAYEWASLPNSKGVGWYDGDKAGNRAKGAVGDVERALLAARSNLAGVALDGKAKPPAAPAAAAPAVVAVAAAERPILYRMVATQDTWLKKAPVQASELPDDQKVRVARGQSYGVVEHREVAAHGHATVVLGGGAGTWTVYESHWSRPGTTAPRPVVFVPALEVAPAATINWADFNFQITPFFTVGEALQWDHRRRPQPGSADVNRLLTMARHHMAIRLQVGYPVGITSAYRPEPINRQVGGVPNSFHIYGMALDVYPVGRPLEELYQHLLHRWTGGLGDGRRRGFVHLDSEGGGGYVPGGGVRPRRWWPY